MFHQDIATRSFRLVLLAMMIAFPRCAMALGSGDLLFYLSFDEGITADYSRGGSQPLKKPANSAERMVEGVLGKGYLFGGQGSGLEFPVASDNSRTAQEQYGPTANLLAETGSVSFWYKALPNETNQHHDFFRFDSSSAFRDHWGVFMFRYGQKDQQIYNTKTPQNHWMHFVVTWRKNELRSYLNGQLWGVTSGSGVLETPPARFTIADEGRITAQHCVTGSLDDGAMDEIQIFGRALAPEEVRSVFERTGAPGYRCDTQFAVVENPISRPPPLGAIALARPKQPIKIDGDRSDWKGIPDHGGWIDTRLGVLDEDSTNVSAASDGRTLFLSFISAVDESEYTDPVIIRYPTGIFQSSPRDRDGNVDEDDYIEFIIEAGGHRYVLAVNPHGSLRDSRDGDVRWNADVQLKSKSELSKWSGELSLSLSQLGIKPGEAVQFNAIRSWKKYKSSNNAIFVDSSSRPRCAPLVIDAPATAAVRTLGKPWEGTIALEGQIDGPAGAYELHITGRGHEIEFVDVKKLDVADGGSPFTYERKLDKSGDQSLAVEVRDASGQAVLKRSMPFVYVAAARTELANYPGWGRLGVKVTPVRKEKASADISLLKDGKAVQQLEILGFTDATGSVMFDVMDLPAGAYEVLTQLRSAGDIVHEERLPYQIRELPEWYQSRAGISDVPPVPWTAMQVDGNSVKMLIKQVDFDRSLFPSQIAANGRPLLAEPIRIRIKQDGKERVIQGGTFEITERSTRRVNWISAAKDGALSITVSGWIEFDGFTWMNVTLKGGQVDELALEIPVDRTSATLTSTGLLGDQGIPNAANGTWIGSEKSGIQFWWEDQRGWVLADKPATITMNAEEALIRVPIIQSRVSLAKERTVSLGWAITPSKPLPENRRFLRANRNITYTNSYYTTARPNYPSPMPGETAESIAQSLEGLRQLQKAPIVLWYAFGPFMWIGAPEYADWWREWRVTSWPEVPPNPTSNEWGWACHQSSGSDLFLHKLDAFMGEYPQQGVYVDCYFLMDCDNEAHGCGWVDEKGVRKPSLPLLATRRHYERLYTIIKKHQPEDGWLRIHDWAPIMPVAAFCDENWVGEGLIGPIASSAEKNYYQVVNMPYARTALGSATWGHLTNWLTELGVYAGTDPVKRSEWYGKMASPPKEGKPGKWIVPRMKDYEHVAGLVLANDLWNFGGNDMGITKPLVEQMWKDVGMDDSVRFVGHWEIGDELELEGGVPENIVCSIYYKPATDRQGNAQKPWLMMVPFNNTDKDVTVTIKPNLTKFGLDGMLDGEVRDAYKAVNYTYQGNFLVQPDDVEMPHIEFKGVDERFRLNAGKLTVKLPKRSFKALILD